MAATRSRTPVAAPRGLRASTTPTQALGARLLQSAASPVVCTGCYQAAPTADSKLSKVGGFLPVFACSRLHGKNGSDPANAIRQSRDSHGPWTFAVSGRGPVLFTTVIPVVTSSRWGERELAR